MAPIDKTMKSKKLAAKDGALKTVKNTSAAAKKKKKWISERKMFEGSVKEGQGFAFQRKQKVKHEYNKLLRKERKRNPGSTALYKEEYPEHLKHLYMAEAEKLRKEAWVNRVNRSKLRIKGQEKEVEENEADADATVGCDTSDAVSGDNEPSVSMEEESLPLSNRMKKKMQKKTSYQKTKEEFEGVIEKREKKKEEYLKNKQQREEAIQKYKQKKMETFQMLSKKTKKGQPNLNLQMEYLLQKIQGNDK